MKKNYLTYPLKNMNITQSYSGSASHLPHTTASFKDYPIDEAGKDTKREYMYCPCDEMVIKRIYGVGGKGTNTVWLESKKEVCFADGTSDYFTLMVTHPNDDDLKNLKIGQVFKRGEKLFREGTDGNASGNHFHLSGGKGKMKGIGWVSNSNGKWVLNVFNKTEKPEKLFFVDKEFTKIKKSGGLSFKLLPDEKEQSENYVVNTSLLNVRKGAGTDFEIVLFKDMTESAKNQIVSLCGKKRDGYVRGVEFTAEKIKDGWAKTPSGWVCLKYCEKIS